MHMWCQHRECNQPIRQPSKVVTVQLGTCAWVRTAKTLYFHHRVYGGGGGCRYVQQRARQPRGGGGRREEGAAELESVTVTGLDRCNTGNTLHFTRAFTVPCEYVPCINTSLASFLFLAVCCARCAGCC
jgi:hypothetical protein